MVKNERTSARVAKIAGKIVAHKGLDRDYVFPEIGLKWSELRALAASCLTQAPDKPKKKGKAK